VRTGNSDMCQVVITLFRTIGQRVILLRAGRGGSCKKLKKAHWDR